jgi:hypothetical protein
VTGQHQCFFKQGCISQGLGTSQLPVEKGVKRLIRSGRHPGFKQTNQIPVLGHKKFLDELIFFSFTRQQMSAKHMSSKKA